MTDPYDMLWHHRMIRAIATLLIRVLGPVERHGLENVPATSGYILTANHLSYFDAPLVVMCLPPRRIFAFAARKYRPHWFFGLVLRLWDIVWVTQRSADREALEGAQAVLERHHTLAMAPEGTRSPTGALIEPRPGVAFLATRTNAVILPVALEGPDQVKFNAPRLRRTRFKLTVGKPFRLAPVEGRGRTQQLQQRTDVIMAHIAVMLAPRYRGVYANHPYVEQLERGAGPLPGELPGD
jgi:1-acyl-sn-glycerol-3-phosphate acyltransferase